MLVLVSLTVVNVALAALALTSELRRRRSTAFSDDPRRTEMRALQGEILGQMAQLQTARAGNTAILKKLELISATNAAVLVENKEVLAEIERRTGVPQGHPTTPAGEA